MNLICRSYGIISELSPRQGVKSILSAGFTGSVMDCSIVSAPEEYENLRRNNFKKRKDKVYLTEEPEKLCQVVENILVKNAQKEGVAMPIAMAPYPKTDIKLGNDVLNATNEIRDIYIALAKEMLRVAVAAGCNDIIIHPLFAGIPSSDEWKINKSFYMELADIAENLDSNINILLINMPQNNNGHFIRGMCAEPEDACRWVDELNDLYPRRFGFCFDIGTATLCGQNVYETIMPLGSRLKAVIVRDCDGIHDVSMLPFTACMKGQQTDWLGVFRALRKISFDGELIMDFGDTYKGFSPMFNHHILKLGCEVGKFFLWQCDIEKLIKKYDKRVLFGAGNMCREYLSNFGNNYPPMFICDNNPSRWGEDFFGITIESPEKLKELSPDVAIFICNMYYDEITAQLKEMNLINPIERFNDEYMPSFHMDRLDMAKNPNEEKGGRA